MKGAHRKLPTGGSQLTSPVAGHAKKDTCVYPSAYKRVEGRRARAQHERKTPRSKTDQRDHSGDCERKCQRSRSACRTGTRRTCGSTSVTQKFEPHPSSGRPPFATAARKLAAEARRPFRRTSGVGGITVVAAVVSGEAKVESFSFVLESGEDCVLGGASARAADMSRTCGRGYPSAWRRCQERTNGRVQEGGFAQEEGSGV